MAKKKNPFGMSPTVMALVGAGALGGWYLYRQKQQAEMAAALAQQRGGAPGGPKKGVIEQLLSPLTAWVSAKGQSKKEPFISPATGQPMGFGHYGARGNYGSLSGSALDHKGYGTLGGAGDTTLSSKGYGTLGQ